MFYGPGAPLRGETICGGPVALCLHIKESMGIKRKKHGTIATPHIGSSSMLPAGTSMLDFRLILESSINRWKAFIYNCF